MDRSATRRDEDLFELCQLANVRINRDVFRTLLELLRLNVSPIAISQMLDILSQVPQEQGDAQ